MINIEHGIYESEDFRLEISLSVEGGEFCAVLGPSGAGKTTLLNIIAGFEDLKRGRLVLANQDVSQLAPAQRPVSMVFQDYNVFPHLDLWSNVALGVSPGLKLTAEQRSEVDAALARVGISALARRRPGDVSGGERQRAALARVLVRKKPILLLDEPFAALDPGLRKDMLHMVQDIAREKALTVLLVSHQPQELRQASNSVIFVGQGKVHATVGAEAFFGARDTTIRAYLG